MKPIYLELNNFLSHGNTTIDFNSFNVALLLGKNGAGKSSILKAIRWVLFDKSNHKKKDGVVKRDTMACRVVYKFSIEDRVYRIIRKRNKVIGESDVVFEQEIDGSFVSIDCDTNTATDAKIVETIGFNHEIFVNSAYFGQGDISVFAESTVGKKKEIIKALLRLKKWDFFQKQTKKYIYKLQAQINEKEKNTISLVNIERDLKKYIEEISDAEIELEEKNTEYMDLSKRLLGLEAELKLIDDNQLQDEFDILTKEVKEDNKKLSEIKTNILKNERLITKNTYEISKAKEKIILCADKIKRAENLNLDDKRNIIINKKVRVKSIMETMNRLKSSKEMSNECLECLRPIAKNETKHILKLKKERFNKLKGEYTDLIGEIKKLEVKFKRLEGLVEKSHEANVIQTKMKVNVKNLKFELDRALKDNEHLLEDKKKIQSKSIYARVLELKSKLDEDSVSDLRKRSGMLRKSSVLIKQDIDDLNIKLGSKIAAKLKTESVRERQITIQSEMAKLYNQMEVFNKVKHSFGRDGIQSVIIENVIDDIENYTNEVLNKICSEPMSISIDSQKQSDSGGWNETFDININMNGTSDFFEALSGGEQFRVSFALRLALNKILSKRMGGQIQFLLLDEVSSSLDEDGIELFVDIIKKLSKEMKILVITHDNHLKEKFENVFLMEKDQTGSKIIYQ